MENEILTIAKQLSQQGKKPTVALIRAKLSQRVAMPVIIQALQRFESLNAQELNSLNEISQAPSQPIEQAPADLAQEIAALRGEITSLKQQVTLLTETVAQLSNKGTKR